MDKSFLSDYSAKESEADTRYADLLARSKFEDARQFSMRRVGRLDEPIGRSAQFSSLWPQVPFFGTIIVPLSPFAEPHFSVLHGFGASQVDALVDFAKETKRVAFVLNDDAQEFAGLDFLDPIFTEMKPTMDVSRPSPFFAERTEDYKRYRIEFDTLARIKFYKYLDRVTQVLSPLLGPSADRSISYATNMMHTYAFLGVMGYSDLKDAIADCIVQSPYTAHGILLSLDHLLVSPMMDPFGSIHNITNEQIARWKSVAGEVGLSPASGGNSYESILREEQDIRFPSDIGRFLMRKLHNYPETLDGCRFVCGLYDQHDLRRIVISLQQAISKSDYSAIAANSSHLSETLDKVWANSSQVEQRKNAIRAGMTVGFGLIGGLASGPIGPMFGGVLGALGFQVVDQILQMKTDSISDILAKRSTPSYLVNIYEFDKERIRIHKARDSGE